MTYKDIEKGMALVLNESMLAEFLKKHDLLNGTDYCSDLMPEGDDKDYWEFGCINEYAFTPVNLIGKEVSLVDNIDFTVMDMDRCERIDFTPLKKVDGEYKERRLRPRGYAFATMLNGYYNPCDLIKEGSTENIINGFKERFDKYLPENFDWEAKIGWIEITFED